MVVVKDSAEWCKKVRGKEETSSCRRRRFETQEVLSQLKNET